MAVLKDFAIVTGTLGIANGGTGQTSLDDILGGSSKVSITNGSGTVIGGDVTIDITESNLDLGNILAIFFSILHNVCGISYIFNTPSLKVLYFRSSFRMVYVGIVA